MNPAILPSLIDIAALHEKRLRFALTNLADIFPIDAAKVSTLGDQEFLLTELLSSRFSKLQDFIGNKLINAVLEHMDEFSSDMTMIDKINKLEKFHLISQAKLWTEMRQLRNLLSHEYPDNPALIARHLNQAYTLSFELIDCLNNLVKVLKT